MDSLELWGGPECTLVRVGDRYGDQFALSGHDGRPDDLDRFATLGIKAIRYPVLWERVAPDRPDQGDWAWTDGRMARLRELGLRAIAGLVHHGSGPRYTSLLDDQGFAAGLARHAGAAARRYPWVRDWTPVNEPVTTARFACLYGHWHPHAADERSFWRALLNEVDATRLAMRAVRAVTPGARLIQTEDLGRTFATSVLRNQAAFDNLRRWAGWDLLCGRLDRAHPLWPHLVGLGFEERLLRILNDPCPPDIIGVNHYLTSDRFLDHRIGRYPAETHGGSVHQRYADVTAIRVLEPAPPGLEGALREAAARYGRPVAVTEVHNGCTRDEQLRWVADAWDTAVRLREDGVDVRAITAWSLIGAHGWNTLLTRPGLYEPGVLDVSGGAPRETALAPLLRGLASGASRHPVTAGAGWWRRPARLLHPVVHRAAPLRAHRQPASPDDARPLLLCGSDGQLGRAIARACALRNLPVVLTDRDTLDIMRPAQIAAALDAHRPWAVVNAAGWTDVDGAERDADGCFAVNADGAALLARGAAERDIPTLSFSTAMVFDGALDRPYLEGDAVAPLNAYGRSKAAMERALAGLAGNHLVIRTGPFLSAEPGGLVATLAELRPLTAEGVTTPAFLPHLVAVALDLLIDGERGLWHLVSGGPIGWPDLAARIAAALQFDPTPRSGRSAEAAPHPRNTALGSDRGASLPSIDVALAELAAEWCELAGARFRRTA